MKFCEDVFNDLLYRVDIDILFLQEFVLDRSILTPWKPILMATFWLHFQLLWDNVVGFLFTGGGGYDIRLRALGKRLGQSTYDWVVSWRVV